MLYITMCEPPPKKKKKKKGGEEGESHSGMWNKEQLVKEDNSCTVSCILCITLVICYIKEAHPSLPPIAAIAVHGADWALGRTNKWGDAAMAERTSEVM